MNRRRVLRKAKEYSIFVSMTSVAQSSLMTMTGKRGNSWTASGFMKRNALLVRYGFHIAIKGRPLNNGGLLLTEGGFPSLSVKHA